MPAGIGETYRIFALGDERDLGRTREDVVAVDQRGVLNVNGTTTNTQITDAPKNKPFGSSVGEGIDFQTHSSYAYAFSVRHVPLARGDTTSQTQMVIKLMWFRILTGTGLRQASAFALAHPPSHRPPFVGTTRTSL